MPFALLRYNANGTLDNTFDSDGRVTTTIATASDASAVTLQPDGKIVAGGYSYDGVTSSVTLARYLVSGVLDTTFGTGGKVIISVADQARSLCALHQMGRSLLLGQLSSARIRIFS